MKKIYTTLACLIILTSVFAQKDTLAPKGGFATVGALITPPYGLGFGLSCVGGARIGKRFTLGFGVDVIKFDDFKSIYVPVYIDARVYMVDGLFIAAQGGYSAYSNEESQKISQQAYLTTKVNGGAYWGAGLGYNFKGKIAPFMLIKYVNYQTVASYKVSYPRSENTTTTNKASGSITIGIKF